MKRLLKGMMSKVFNIQSAYALVMALAVSSQARADLIVRGADALGNRLIYDTSQNITWYDFNPGAGTYWTQSWWADNLTVDFGGATYNDWRLTKPAIVVHGQYGDRMTGELGHLYVELGNDTWFMYRDPFQHLGGSNIWTLDEHWQWYGDYFNLTHGTYNNHTHDQWFEAVAVRYGDVLGGTSSGPILPGTLGHFNFGVGQGQRVFIDPLVAVGYDYLVSSGPNMQSVLLPNIGDGLFDLYLYSTSLGDYVFDRVLTQGISYDFGGSGIDRFRIGGIETSAGLNPNDPTAFITGLTFASNGIVDMSMTPLTFDTGSQASVPEPGTMMLMGSGLAGLAFMRWFRKGR